MIQFRVGTEGNSEKLFRAIIDELSFQNSPLVKLFWQGNYVKNAKCQKCAFDTDFTEDIFIIRVKDINYIDKKAKDGTLFQPTEEQRFCDICESQTVHQVKITFESLPEILVIALSNVSVTQSARKLLPRIRTETSNFFF